ncbi:M28 family peptidase [Dactylosporangium cerinum]
MPLRRRGVRQPAPPRPETVRRAQLRGPRQQRPRRHVPDVRRQRRPHRRLCPHPHPVGTSLAVEVYRLLSNDTDFTPFLAQPRFTGLNTAYIDGSSVYHSPFDRPSTMDRASLQHHGDNALALAREFGGADLPPLLRPPPATPSTSRSPASCCATRPRSPGRSPPSPCSPSPPWCSWPAAAA